MSLVSAPLSHREPEAAVTAAPARRAMAIGQHVMAASLTAIGVIRVVGDGTPVFTAVIAGAAIVGWHTAGALLMSRSRSSSLAVWWLLGLAAVWIGAVAISPEFVWVAFLLWLLAGHLLPLPGGLLFSAVVLAVVVAGPVMHDGSTTYANVFGPLIGGVFAFAISRGYLRLLSDAAERERLVASLTTAQREMADLQDELVVAQRQAGAVAERTRISRDIHDTIAQSLSSIRLLAHAGAARSVDEDAVRTFTQLEAVAGDSLGDVRRIVAALAPAELDENVLADALGRMLDRAHDETGLLAELRVGEHLPPLSTAVEVALLRVAQSALANVRVHAGASSVTVTLIEEDRSVRLDIVDDGRGFDVAAWEREPGTGMSGYGLRFMRTRMRELGGDLGIRSAPGAGTAVSVRLPLHADARLSTTSETP